MDEAGADRPRAVICREGRFYSASCHRREISVTEARCCAGYSRLVSAVQAALLGRKHELAVLERALVEVERGPARLVGLRGEPGIGKSRLLAEVAARAEQRGHLVLAGRATELERDLPFALLIDTLDRHLAQDPPRRLDDDHLAQLAGVLPAIGGMPGVEPARSSDGRHRVARAVRALLELLARPQPVTVILDDVQWADAASADVVALLLHRPPQRHVLIALATREGRAPDLEAALETAVRNDSAEVLDVGPLSRKEANGLIGSLGRAAREQLYVQSGGNPFYLEALARAVGPDARRSAVTGIAGVPRAVRAALAGEVAVLPAPMREVLEGAAVAGDPFEPEMAGAAAGVSESAVLTALDELHTADLIRPTDDPRRFRFRHPLVRRAVYEGTTGGSRLAAHARAADALAARGATPAQRAHHTERSARLGDLNAVNLLAEAAEQTASRAPATAAGWYGSALRLLPDGPKHDVRRLALLRSQADTFTAANRAVDARDALRRALGMLPAEPVVAWAEVIAALAHLEVWIGNFEEAHDRLTEARSRIGDRAPREFALLTLELAAERYACGDFESVEHLVEQARAAARKAGDRTLEAAAAVQAAGTATEQLRGINEAALARAERLLNRAEALIDALPDDALASRLESLLSLATAQLYADRPAWPRAERGLRLSRATGQGFLAAAFTSLVGYAAERSGDLDSARVAAEEAVESALVSGNPTIVWWGSQLSAWVAVAEGRASDAVADAEVALEVIRSHPPHSAGWTLAEARLASGDPRWALQALESSGGVDPHLPPSDRLRALEVVVRANLALERTNEAATLAAHAPAEAAGRRTGTFGAITGLIEAQVLLAREESAEAARAALHGVAAAQEAGAPLWEGRCRTIAGEALAAAGKSDEAREELRRAADDLDARGAAGYRDAALRVLRRLGERPRPAPAAAAAEDEAGGLAVLTPREREVAALVAEGRTNRQIGAQLHLSEKTIEKHVSRAMAKLGVTSRTGIARLVEREGAGLGA
jgi:DNA-binding CsgD family transcriptional regulator